MPKNKESREEKMSALQERLVDGVKEIYESGKWAEYIAVMSKFPNYSINNCILIASQCPGASFVCGYKKWNEFNRNVMKGESGIMIFAPIKSKIKVEEPLYDIERAVFIFSGETRNATPPNAPTCISHSPSQSTNYISVSVERSVIYA